MPESVNRELSAIKPAYGHTVAVDEATRGRLFGAARVLFAVVIIAVLAAAALHNWHELRDVELELTPGWLLVAAPFTFAGGVLLPLAWRHVVASYGHPLPRATAVRVWCVSQASRFIPGNVALIASRVVLSAREGVPRSLAGASLAIEGALIIVWGGFFASWLPSTWLPAGLPVLLAAGALAVLALLPFGLRRIGRRLTRFPALAPTAQRRRDFYEATGLYGLNNLIRACGFVFVAAAMHTIDPRDAWLIIGATNLGAALGMIGITPAGLGVREGVIAVLLTPRFGAGNATAIAVGFRAWDFLFELVWLSIAVVWERRTRSEMVEVTPADVP